MSRPGTGLLSHPVPTRRVGQGGGWPVRTVAAGARPKIRFRLLGPLEVTRDGEVVTPRAYKVRLLLAALLVRSGMVIPVDGLIRVLWGDSPPRTALQATRVYVSQLRQVLAGPDGGGAPMLVSLPAGYRLDVDADTFDVLEFQERCRLARTLQESRQLAAAAEQYRIATGLWRGPCLADVRGCPQLEAAAVQLEEACIAAVERRIDLDLRLDRHLDLIAELFALTAEYPLNESLHARLMIALHRAGRTSDALAVYRSLREALVDELGVEPDKRLQSIHQAVLAAEADAIDLTDLWTL